MPSSGVALVEPLMEGFAHALVNAALLHSVVLAYPDEPVSFRGFASHVEFVREILTLHAPHIIDRVDWGLLAPAPSSVISRWCHSRRIVRQALASGDRVLLCAISRMQLWQLKRSLRRGHSVRVILHSELDRFEHESTQKFPMNLLSLRRLLLGAQPAGLRYEVLGRSIFDHIPPVLHRFKACAGFIDLPYYFAEPRQAPPDAVVFGVFGNAGDGERLAQFAEAVHAVDPSVRISLVGHVAPNPATAERLRRHVGQFCDRPLSHEAFVDRATVVTYALWLAEPEAYKTRASATFFDALAYVKPLIYTANAFVDAYLAEAPEIGIRCDGIEEAVQAVLRQAANHDHAAYAQAQAAIRRFRERFAPQALAKRLPEALQWVDA